MGFFDSTDDESQKYLQQALGQYAQAAVPDISQETVRNLPQESVQGEINPNQIQAADQAPSAYGNIALDPQTRQAQINALGQYSNIADQGGLDAEGKLAIQQAIDAANTQSQGAQGAIQNQAQAMGQGGGDFALTQRAIAAQGASNNAATQGMQAAALSEQNRQNALNQMASIGGNVNASDYGQQANAAAAQNQINAANQGYQNAANVGNVGNNMSAQMSNLQNAQNVNASNTAANQNQTYYNANLPQQQFNNELAKANGMAGVNSQQAQAAQTASQNSANQTGQLIKGGATLLGTIYGGPMGGAAAGAAAGSLTGGSGGGSQGFAHSGADVSSNSYNRNAQGMNPYMSEGGMMDHYVSMLMGGHVPGEPNVAGDSQANDTVPAMLSPGEIVIKRSKAASPESAAEEARRISLEHFTKGYRRGK